MPPVYSIADYDWNKPDNQPIRVVDEGQTVGNDTFTYMTLTIDYWYLSTVKRGLDTLKFVDMRTALHTNFSVMRWETDEYEDELCSYSGFVFGKRTAGNDL